MVSSSFSHYKYLHYKNKYKEYTTLVSKFCLFKYLHEIFNFLTNILFHKAHMFCFRISNISSARNIRNVFFVVDILGQLSNKKKTNVKIDSTLFFLVLFFLYLIKVRRWLLKKKPLFTHNKTDEYFDVIWIDVIV